MVDIPDGVMIIDAWSIVAISCLFLAVRIHWGSQSGYVLIIVVSIMVASRELLAIFLIRVIVRIIHAT